MPTNTAAHGISALGTLTIDEFDQWTDSSEPGLRPTTICWSGDPEVDFE